MRRYTIRAFEGQFPDDKACLAFLFKARWPQGVTCARRQPVSALEGLRNELSGQIIAPEARYMAIGREWPARIKSVLAAIKGQE